MNGGCWEGVNGGCWEGVDEGLHHKASISTFLTFKILPFALNRLSLYIKGNGVTEGRLLFQPLSDSLKKLATAEHHVMHYYLWGWWVGGKKNFFF